MLIYITILYSSMTFSEGVAVNVSLSSLNRIPSWLHTLNPRSEGDQSRRSALKTLDRLIKDAEETVADLKRLGADKQLIKDYEKEIADLDDLRKKIRNK